MEIAYIALGANLPSPAGNPRQTLDAAILRLAEVGAILARSNYYSTEPVGYADQPVFRNAAVASSCFHDGRITDSRYASAAARSCPVFSSACPST